MKENICTAAGVVGGWDSALITLIIFMAIDFTTGMIAAAMGKSKHSKTGRLSSKAGWVGLAKKFCILPMVIVAVRMDIMIGTTYIRDAACIGFCANELLSIIENTSLMGIPYPPAIKKGLDAGVVHIYSLLNNNRRPKFEPELDKDIAYLHVLQQLPH